MNVTTRAHIVIADDVLSAVDRVAGKRRRSQYIEEAVRERLERDNLLEVMEETVGSLNPADYPYWETPEKTSEWIRNLREIDNERLAELFPEPEQ
jgi:hypothetical protein